MNNTEFITLAENTIIRISDIIEEQDVDCLIDIDFQGDVLNLITDKGIFAINKQSAVQEIWLSSPVSGPYHFFYKHKVWKTKNNVELMSILSQELDINFN